MGQWDWATGTPILFVQKSDSENLIHCRKYSIIQIFDRITGMNN